MYAGQIRRVAQRRAMEMDEYRQAHRWDEFFDDLKEWFLTALAGIALFAVVMVLLLMWFEGAW